jgi:cytoskeleton protein RodZ
MTSSTPEKTPGAWLQQEREKAGRTIESAAKDLYLETWVIQAIEKDKFAAIGAPVFVKGRLRQYAGLLGVPAEQVLERYHEFNGELTASREAANDAVMKQSRRSLPWMAAGAVALAAAAGWWLFGRR